MVEREDVHRVVRVVLAEDAVRLPRRLNSFFDDASSAADMSVITVQEPTDIRKC